MTTHKETCWDKFGQTGFSLIELVIVIVVLGILAAFAVPKFADMTTSSKVTATKDELNLLKRSIVGNPSAVAGGVYIDRGFEGDVGFAPSRLQDLAVKPDSVPVYNKITRIGWNGPYIDTAGGSYLKDAWGVNYSYDATNRRLKSVGGGADSVVVTF
jgi:prepilin-type N-terminal cleavage/methylation domain-containing protein